MRAYVSAYLCVHLCKHVVMHGCMDACICMSAFIYVCMSPPRPFGAMARWGTGCAGAGSRPEDAVFWLAALALVPLFSSLPSLLLGACCLLLLLLCRWPWVLLFAFASVALLLVSQSVHSLLLSVFILFVFQLLCVFILISCQLLDVFILFNCE